MLTEIPGSSAVVERGFVVYSNEAKQEMLGVAEEVLAVHGAVSEATARAMALGALARRGRPVFALERRFGALSRFAIRLASVETALELIEAALAPDQPGLRP